jgi:hypothetical protein
MPQPSRNRSQPLKPPAGKNPQAAALWLASLKRLGLLKALAEVAGTTTVSIRKAAERMKV